MGLQVGADAVEVGLQPVHVGVVVVGVVQDVGQVIVQDVGVQAADLQMVLKTVKGEQRSGCFIVLGGHNQRTLLQVLLSNQSTDIKKLHKV